jgi:mono/diheme cytochrome c family protein
MPSHERYLIEETVSPARKTFLVVLLVLLIAVGTAGYLFLRSCCGTRQAPTAAEAWFARGVRSLGVPADARAAHNPLISTPALVVEGAHHFADHCANCHANDGGGNTEMGRGLYPRVPDMRLPDTQSLSDGELYYIIHNGVRWTGMPAWGGPGEDEDTWKLVLFIRHLPQLTEQEVKDMAQFNPRSPAELKEEQEERDFLNGAPAEKQGTRK